MKRCCNRCGYEWYGRTPNTPKVCSKCKSPYWNKERKKDVGEKEHDGENNKSKADNQS